MTSKTIYSVTEPVTAWLNKKNPPSLGVAATGMTRTGGWTNGRLAARVYVTPPEDGVQEFDFIADAPTGMVIQALMPIAGMGGLDPAPDWLRGVRVITETNSVESLFGPALAGEALESGAYEDESSAGFVESADSGESPIFLETMQTALESFAVEAAVCKAITLVSVGGVPEFKTEMTTKCVLRIGGRCVAKADVPVVYRRETKLVAYATVCHPSLNDLIEAVTDCLKQAVGAGVLAGVFTGNPGAVAPALKAYLIACLKVKTGKVLDDFDLSVGTRKESGRWIPV
ncbi:MAG: hypothetical protein RIA71_02655 [Oceanicaulis sp.]